MGSDEKVFTPEGPLIKFLNLCYEIIDKPVVWVRENIVVPNRKEYYWYHERFRRVPTIDECYTDDEVCKYEAEQQFKRDRKGRMLMRALAASGIRMPGSQAKKVEKFIVQILKMRYEFCMFENPNDKEDCAPLKETYDKAALNYFIKYGELGALISAENCLMKQKNRMAWERRHGPIGSGKKPVEEHWGKEKKKSCD